MRWPNVRFATVAETMLAKTFTRQEWRAWQELEALFPN